MGSQYMNSERRTFEREEVNIPFIFTLDDVDTIAEGEWHEAHTIDIGPVLVGGLAFYTDLKIESSASIRIALFMDLELRKTWKPGNESFPIYKGTVCRITNTDEGQRIAVMFKGFGRKMEEFLDSIDVHE